MTPQKISIPLVYLYQYAMYIFTSPHPFQVSTQLGSTQSYIVYWNIMKLVPGKEIGNENEKYMSSYRYSTLYKDTSRQTANPGMATWQAKLNERLV